MYSAAFGSMFEGSMCGAGANVFAVWLFALSRCDKDGDVELGTKAVSLLIGCSEDDVKSAINYLTATDEDSRSSAEGGARLKLTGKIMYRIVNYEYYKKIASYEKKKEADRLRKNEKDAAERAMKQTRVAKGSEGSRMDRDRDREIEDRNTPPNPPAKARGEKRKRFVQPTADEVQSYLDEKEETSFTGEEFVDANIAKGWVVGTTKTPMKDWKATVRTWITNRKKKDAPPKEASADKSKPGWSLSPGAYDALNSEDQARVRVEEEKDEEW
jgi:hypothetical protein